MYKRLASAVVALMLSVFALALPPKAEAAAPFNPCELNFYAGECPSDLEAFCLANQTYPCPNPPYSRFWDANCTSGYVQCHYR